VREYCCRADFPGFVLLVASNRTANALLFG
jgi:hypothetical protein